MPTFINYVQTLSWVQYIHHVTYNMTGNSIPIYSSENSELFYFRKLKCLVQGCTSSQKVRKWRKNPTHLTPNCTHQDVCKPWLVTISEDTLPALMRSDLFAMFCSGAHPFLLLFLHAQGILLQGTALAWMPVSLIYSSSVHLQVWLKLLSSQGNQTEAVTSWHDSLTGLSLFPWLSKPPDTDPSPIAPGSPYFTYHWHTNPHLLLKTQSWDVCASIRGFQKKWLWKEISGWSSCSHCVMLLCSHSETLPWREERKVLYRKRLWRNLTLQTSNNEACLGKSFTQWNIQSFNFHLILSTNIQFHRRSIKLASIAPWRVVQATTASCKSLGVQVPRAQAVDQVNSVCLSVYPIFICPSLSEPEYAPHFLLMLPQQPISLWGRMYLHQR